jgi:hypothetical protein
MTKYIGNPAFQVHTQTGAMKRSLKSSYSATNNIYKIWFDKGIAPHAEEVILGTRVMLPRDVMWSTATAPGTKKLMTKGIIKTLGKTLRSQAVVSVSSDMKESFKFVILSMNKANFKLALAASRAHETAGNALMEKIKENVSLRDHSQEDLDRMGNPYAKRHGTIGIHG